MGLLGQGWAAAPNGQHPPASGSPPAAPRWSVWTSAHTGFGYKDNLLLSHVNEERSAFARGGVEAFAWRLPRGRVDYVGMLGAEGTRYFSGEAIENEANAFLAAEGRYRIRDVFTFGIRGRGYYFDQIFDVSNTEVQRTVAELKQTGFRAGPAVRWAFVPWAWVELDAARIRDTYHDGSLDAWVSEAGARLGWEPTRRFVMSIGAREHRRDFDRREQLSFSGRVIEGTRLAVRERGGDAQVEIVWDDAGQWTTTTEARYVHYTDNGSGYFNYRERGITQEIEWSRDPWRVEFEGSAARFDFEVQIVGLGLFPPPRIKDEFFARVRVERTLSERWGAYAEFSWERSRGNEVVSSYVVNEGLLGIRWSWEK